MSEADKGFHATGGWYFRREDDGSVFLTAPDSLGPGAHQIITLPPETWASVVASVSARGDNVNTYIAAHRFHEGQAIPPDLLQGDSMSDQKPTLGRIVHYVLNEGDVAAINQQHPDKSKYNPVRAEQTLPAIVVATFGGTTVNLQVLLDGYGSYWATSRQEGDGPFYWAWPPRV